MAMTTGGFTVSSAPRPLHRIAEVRRQQDISMRRMATVMRRGVEFLRSEEDPHADLPLSRLYAWQKALDVPVADLLVDTDATLSAPVLARARMIRLMKTVAAIAERAVGTETKQLAQMLEEQLLEIMPELEGVTPWHSVGQRRTREEFGRAMQHVYSSKFFVDE